MGHSNTYNMLQRFYGLVYFSAVLLFVTLTGTQAECPVQLNPQRAVVRYEGSVEVNCSTSVPHKGLGWEASEGAVPMARDKMMIAWRVSHLTEWDIQPFCYINYERQCQVELPVIIYKTPDSVSISIVDHSGPMIEGQQYELQCDVHDVAPVQYLTVKWYKGQTLLDKTTFTEYIKTPVNENATLLIRPDRADGGAQYRCEAELELGAEGPQPPPKKTSEPLNINVYFFLVNNFYAFILCSSMCLTGTQAECPVQLNPQRAVVRYGGSVAVNCRASVPHKGLGWEASEGAVPMTRDKMMITWRVSHLTEWDIQPFCYINHEEQCQVELPVTIYKYPDSVSISIVDHSGPMIEGRQYELQCDVHDVAPVQYLTVKWYKGQTLLDKTTFTEDSKTPVNETATLLIRPDRADGGAQYRCEAELELGAEGPQPPPKKTSEPLNINVYFKLIINENKLPSIVPVFRGYPEVLVCEAEGNPKPTISWILGTNVIVYNETLTISESTPEHVYCTSDNSVGRATRQVNVSIQGNYAFVSFFYIPIILGIFVAVVVAISVIFIFIYIYLTNYKKTKTGHYDVKEANAHKELLAQPVPP
ncbi:LOW QUALITY PROTEIN: intercellular adhesion molecule 1 [Cyprinus carpio]|uniref:LOW QUALITY PROTEIN: intercellular adhesion molecule 1 n=1 Tax=Cyprinus carpio TaxID=7962 RepID=A0A9Q9WSB9_CYPCA|nr:LOW QUALITY PROTEIN: intercellular adhesion molecule 1 [Cyprinus carpio]